MTANYRKEKAKKLEEKKKAALRKVEREFNEDIKNAHQLYKGMRNDVDKDDKRYKTKIADLNAKQKDVVKTYEKGKKDAIKAVEEEFKIKIRNIKV